jgi:hypothetical protein
MARAKPVQKRIGEDRRLAILAQEMALSATQTLREEFGFTPQLCNEFLQKWMERAKRNRGGSSG